MNGAPVNGFPIPSGTLTVSASMTISPHATETKLERADHRNEVHRTLLRGMGSGKPKRHNILVVEDEPIVRMNARDMFEDAGSQSLRRRMPTRPCTCSSAMAARWPPCLPTSTCRAAWTAWIWRGPSMSAGRISSPWSPRAGCPAGQRYPRQRSFHRQALSDGRGRRRRPRRLEITTGNAAQGLFPDIHDAIRQAPQDLGPCFTTRRQGSTP